MYPVLDLPTTRVSAASTGFKGKPTLSAALQESAATPFPDPDIVMDFEQCSPFKRLPSFLTSRAEVWGMQGNDKTHRVDHFLLVPFEIRNHIMAEYRKCNLSDNITLELMLRLPISELQRMESCWRTIEDCLVFSSPENFLREYDAPIRRIFDWFVSAYVYQGYTVALKTWKLFINRVKQLAALAEGQPSEPNGFPWWDFRRKKFLRTGIVWLDRVCERGLKSKGECTRLMHLISPRGAPTPDGDQKLNVLLEHQVLLRTEPVKTDISRLIQLFRYAEAIGRRVSSQHKRKIRRTLLRAEHVSLTNSSCFENPRSNGGRATVVQDAVYAWANFVPAEDKEYTGVLGHIVQERKGIPRWKTYTVMAAHSLKELSEDTNFGDRVSSEGILDKRAGFNENLGCLILQVAFDEAIKKNIIDSDYNVIGKMKMRALALGEPSNKVRALTVLEWFGTILLQPLGHCLVNTLATLPETQAGLTGGEPLWRFLQQIQLDIAKGRLDTMYVETAWFKSSDLEKATDHCHPDKSRYILLGYLTGLGVDFINPFMIMSVELLVARRSCIWSLV
jgi:hypothetical protein